MVEMRSKEVRMDAHAESGEATAAATAEAEVEQPVAYPHLWFDDRGRPWIDDTNIKVIEVVLDHIGYGWNAQEIHDQFPYLSLAQIHAALTYYFDHKAEMDAEIERQHKEYEELRAKAN